MSRSTTVLICCILAAFCEGIDIQAAGVAAAGVIPEFKLLPEQLGLFFSASTLGLFIGALIGGRIADAFGRKILLIASSALFGIFSLSTTLAWNFETLYLARLFTGLGLGGALPTLITLAAESSEPRRRQLSVALAYAGAPFGGAVVSLIVMLIVPSHWRIIFIIGGIAPLVLAAVMLRVLDESAAYAQVVVAGVAAGDAMGDTAQAPRAGIFAILSNGRVPRTFLLWISFFFSVLMLSLLLNWLPTLLAASGLSKSDAAGAQIGFNIGGTAATILIGLQLETARRKLSVVITFIAMPLLVLALGAMPNSIAALLAIVFVLGAAVLAAQTVMYALAPTCYPTVIRGTGVGAAVAAGRLGSIAGPALGGVLRGMGHDPSRLMFDLVPIAAVGSVCALWLAFSRAPTTDQ